MDEIFSSTNPDEGISGAYSIAKNISQNTNNISIITSHYSYLSKLEETGRFKNYKIPISRDSDNNIVYEYKLVSGVSNQFIALELLKKKGFDTNIVDEAQDICKKMNNSKKIIRPSRKIKKITKKPEEDLVVAEENIQKPPELEEIPSKDPSQEQDNTNDNKIISLEIEKNNLDNNSLGSESNLNEEVSSINQEKLK